MAITLEWVTGTDGTEYCINTKNGKVVGSIADAGTGLDIYKVGFGGDFTARYRGRPNAIAAIEATAKMTTGANKASKD